MDIAADRGFSNLAFKIFDHGIDGVQNCAGGPQDQYCIPVSVSTIGIENISDPFWEE